MPEFPDLIAAVGSALESARQHDPSEVPVALAALDVLAAGVWLTREEAETIPPEKLRGLATWLDLDDKHMGRLDDEVQRDLRKWADILAARLSEAK